MVVSSSNIDDKDHCGVRSPMILIKLFEKNKSLILPSAFVQTLHLKNAGIHVAVTPTHSQWDQHKHDSHWNKKSKYVYLN